jgi:hypothetical protein
MKYGSNSTDQICSHSGENTCYIVHHRQHESRPIKSILSQLTSSKTISVRSILTPSYPCLGAQFVTNLSSIHVLWLLAFLFTRHYHYYYGNGFLLEASAFVALQPLWTLTAF